MLQLFAQGKLSQLIAYSIISHLAFMNDTCYIILTQNLSNLWKGQGASPSNVEPNLLQQCLVLFWALAWWSSLFYFTTATGCSLTADMLLPSCASSSSHMMSSLLGECQNSTGWGSVDVPPFCFFNSALGWRKGNLIADQILYYQKGK